MYSFAIFSPYKDRLKAGMTDQSMGSFRPEEEGFEARVEHLNLGKPVLADQIHSDIVLKVDAMPPHEVKADAFMSQQNHLLLGVKLADCQGVILFDPIQKAVAVVHSGWKGSVQNIIGKTIQRMRAEFGTQTNDLLVAIGPSLGPCCAEFTDPLGELPDFCHPFVGEDKHVDFWSLSKKQCADEGVSESQVEVAGVCTRCTPGYFSHRRGDVGRMLAFAKLI